MLISRGRIEARKCPRRYYYTYLHRGGWERPETNMDLFIGILTHKGMEGLFKTSKLEEALQWQTNSFGELKVKYFPELEKGTLKAVQVDEALRLSQALTIAWEMSGQHAHFLKEFTVHGVEEEMSTLFAPNVELISRLDLWVQDVGGTHWVVNFKTATDLNDWNQKWKYDIQMWTEAMSLEHKTGGTVGGCYVIGLKKGSRRNGLVANPLIYGYRKLAKDGSFTYDSQYHRDYEKFQVWEDEKFGETPEERLINWIKGLPVELLMSFFALSEPILKNDLVVEHWKRGVVRWLSDAEYINAEASDADKLVFFDQRFSAMNCKFCPFENICVGLSTIDSMITSKFLTPRSSPITEKEKMLEGME